MKNYLKNNLLTIVLFVITMGYLVFISYRDKPNTVNPIISINYKDSIESAIKEQYRLKLDSVITTYNIKINKKIIKNKQLEKNVENYNNDIGELPDFK